MKAILVASITIILTLFLFTPSVFAACNASCGGNCSSALGLCGDACACTPSGGGGTPGTPVCDPATDPTCGGGGGGCTANCNGKICGQGNGCGGRCGTSGVNNFASCGASTPSGTCGTSANTASCIDRCNDTKTIPVSSVGSGASSSQVTQSNTLNYLISSVTTNQVIAIDLSGAYSRGLRNIDVYWGPNQNPNDSDIASLEINTPGVSFIIFDPNTTRRNSTGYEKAPTAITNENILGVNYAARSRINIGSTTTAMYIMPVFYGTNLEINLSAGSLSSGINSITLTSNGSSSCSECGPYNGPWLGTCVATDSAQSNFRNVTHDCSAPTVETQACAASITGAFFDASGISSCPATGIGSRNPVVGALVTATSLASDSSVIATYSAVTDSSGSYAFDNPFLPVPGTYQIDYSADPTRWISAPPKLQCDGTIYPPEASIVSFGPLDFGVTAVRRAGLWRIFPGWFQTQGGDIYANTELSVTIPESCTASGDEQGCNNYFGTDSIFHTPLTVKPANSDVGLVYTNSDIVDLGGGGLAGDNSSISDDGISAVGAGPAIRRYDYTYFDRWFSNLGTTDYNGVGKPTGAANSLYRHSGSLTWNTSLDVGDYIAIENDGDVSISDNVTVPIGAYLTIIANGTITFENNVTSAEGNYIADTLVVETTGSQATDQRFLGQGTFVGWDAVILKRDRGNLDNSESSEFFTFRPDFVINAPRGMRNPKISWQEVAP